MPKKPLPPCRQPGCAKRAEPGERYCKDHIELHRSDENRRYNAENRDKDAQRFYDSKAWRAVRSRHIKAEPLCRMCKAEGRLTPATLVDHIVPIKQGGAKLDESNLQSLCNACHERKSNEEGSRGNRWGG